MRALWGDTQPAAKETGSCSKKNRQNNNLGRHSRTLCQPHTAEMQTETPALYIYIYIYIDANKGTKSPCTAAPSGRQRRQQQKETAERGDRYSKRHQVESLSGLPLNLLEAAQLKGPEET